MALGLTAAALPIGQVLGTLAVLFFGEPARIWCSFAQACTAMLTNSMLKFPPGNKQVKLDIAPGIFGALFAMSPSIASLASYYSWIATISILIIGIFSGLFFKPANNRAIHPLIPLPVLNNNTLTFLFAFLISASGA